MLPTKKPECLARTVEIPAVRSGRGEVGQEGRRSRVARQGIARLIEGRRLISVGVVLVIVDSVVVQVGEEIIATGARCGQKLRARKGWRPSRMPALDGDRRRAIERTLDGFVPAS